MARPIPQIQSRSRRHQLPFTRMLVTLATAIAVALPSTRASATESVAERVLDCELCPPSQKREQQNGQRPQAPALGATLNRQGFPLECETNVGFAKSVGQIYVDAALVALMLVPHPGFQWRPDSRRPFRATLSWPWSLPVGPVTSSARHLCRIDEYRSHRIVLEPGLVLGTPPVLFVRPGYRFLWHPADSLIGIGAGIGSTWELTGGLGVRGSASPEFLLQLGKCCGFGFALLSVRLDYFFAATERTVVTTNLGITLW